MPHYDGQPPSLFAGTVKTNVEELGSWKAVRESRTSEG